MRLRRSAFVSIAAAALACGGCSERPNIVLIVGDDVGWSDFGFMGSADVRTPNLDRLAAEGAVFTRAMSSASTCKPALRTLLTGLEPADVVRRLRDARSGGAAPIFRDVFDTLPERLARRGYASFQAGKFWEGSFDMGGFTHGMTRRFGDDAPEWEGFHRYAGADGLAIGRETMEPLFAFLEEVGGRQPVFVWYAPMLPHLPHDAPAEYVAQYAGGPAPGWLRAYRATVTWFDATVGALLGELDALDLRRDTLVVYVSDNGWDASRSDGARGKASLFETGYRTPLVIAWPGVVAPGRDGRLVKLADVFATLLDAAGAPPAEDSDGRSLLPLLTGEGDFHRDHVVGGGGSLAEGAFWVRTPTWRYQRAHGRESLFRIEDDPAERKDVAQRHPVEVARMREYVRRYLEER